VAEASFTAEVRDRLRTGAGSRAAGICLALLIEVLLLLALLSLNRAQPGREDKAATVVSLKVDDVSEEVPEVSTPKPEQRAEEQPPAPERPAPEQPLPPRPAEPLPRPPVQPKAAPLVPAPLPPLLELPPSAALRPNPASPPKRAYGPPDKGGSAASRDSERVGTAPNGEPLYAAAWYREPSLAQMRGYLSTASGPGWGLIACRTAPDYRVEDCVGLDEYPQGSQMMRAVLAAAWEFKVQPPRLGGRPLIGSWVRIRIDYAIDRR
jgi:protein TonB